MGYRNYFCKISKKELEEIRKYRTVAELAEWGKATGRKVMNYGDENEFYLPVFNIGETIYDFGKDVDWAHKLQKNENIFSSNELKEAYAEEHDTFVCSQTDFLAVIDVYKEKIINYYEKLLAENKEAFHTSDIGQKCKAHVRNQLYEWKNAFDSSPVNTDLSVNTITGSWLYEYAIFELVRLYKTFDWENDALLFLGW